MKEWEMIRKICEALWDSEDPDCKAAEEYGFKEQIIQLFEDCYDAKGFLDWLANHDCCIADGFRYAEIVSKEEYSADGWDEEDWNSACEDSLFYNDEYACMRW